MAIMRTDTKHYKAIGDAINTKKKTNKSYLPEEMAPEILSIKAGSTDTLPPQVTNLEVAASFTSTNTVAITGNFKNVPAEQRQWLKHFIVTFKPNALPNDPNDGTQLIISDTASDFISFNTTKSGVNDGDIYGFRVFPVSIEDSYQTSMGSNVALLTLRKASSILNDNSWEVVKGISASGNAGNYWKVGDTKEILLNGKIGESSFYNRLWVYIIGINHNWEVEGKGITFEGFKEGQNTSASLSLVDAQYAQTSFKAGKYFNMNHYETMPTKARYIPPSRPQLNENQWAWQGCNLRYDVLGSCKAWNQQYASEDTATSPVPNTLMSALPADFRKVLKPFKKYTANTGKTDNENFVTETTDFIPILAEFELEGLKNYANSAEQNHQKQYEFYSQGNSKYHHLYYSTTERCYLWLRSCKINAGEMEAPFCVAQIKYSGAASYDECWNSYGISPLFLV